MSFHNVWTKFIRNEDGNFGVMAAVSIFALLLMAGAATDSQYLSNKQTRLQSASDAIALSAFQSGEQSQSELKSLAEDYLSTVYAGAERDQISVANILRDGDEVRIILAQDLEGDRGFFLPRGDIGVSAQSNAGNAGERINFSLVLDTTGSMKNNGRIGSLMTASNRLIDRLEDVDNDQFRVSVVPFATYVNVGLQNQNAPWLKLPTSGTWNGCVGSRLGDQAINPEFDGDPMVGVLDGTGNNFCGEEILPLTRNLSSVRSKVNSLTPRGSTYLPSGLMWGWRTLEASEPYTEASATFTGGQTPRKVMLFMTDGANTRAQQGNAHTAPRTPANVSKANLQTQLVCDAAKDDDVEIYTIALQVDDQPTRDLLLDCASSADQSFTAETEAELISAFDQIGRELGRLRLTN